MTDSLKKNYSFSIVIPTYNEQDNITNCLDSIFKQNYDKSLVDVVIVDGQSSDKTVSKIKEYQQKFSNISLLENPVRKTPTSLNIGIRQAKGEIIVILGSHSRSGFHLFNNKYLIEKFESNRWNSDKHRIQLVESYCLSNENPFEWGVLRIAGEGKIC
jgi:glycosyltransferase involved in cell wall biosynthesis